MQFRPDEVPSFLTVFYRYAQQIRSVEGCEHMELLRDQADPTVFFTWSHWKSEEHLNRYRHSDLFGEIWPQTKALFAVPAQAWSVESVAEPNAD